MQNDTKDFSFEITKSLLTLSTNPTSKWTKELNLVSWRGRTPKFDIREWSDDHQKMSKGITLSNEEAKRVCEAIMKEIE